MHSCCWGSRRLERGWYCWLRQERNECSLYCEWANTATTSGLSLSRVGSRTLLRLTVTVTLTAKQDEVQRVACSKPAKFHFRRLLSATSTGHFSDRTRFATWLLCEEGVLRTGWVEDTCSELLGNHRTAGSALQVAYLLVYIWTDLLATNTITKDTVESSLMKRWSSLKIWVVRCIVRLNAI